MLGRRVEIHGTSCEGWNRWECLVQTEIVNGMGGTIWSRWQWIGSIQLLIQRIDHSAQWVAQLRVGSIHGSHFV